MRHIAAGMYDYATQLVRLGSSFPSRLIRRGLRSVHADCDTSYPADHGFDMSQLDDLSVRGTIPVVSNCNCLAGN